MKRNKVVVTVLLVLIITGGIAMTKPQEKPPLLNSQTSTVYGQPMPMRQPVPPPPPGQAAPPPQIGSLSKIQLSNASLAVATAKKAKSYLTAGKVWAVIGPRGETDIKAAILYDGTAVAVLHFNPEDGSILLLGVHPIVGMTTDQIENIKKEVPAIVEGLEVLDGAEYREPENAWVVPLAYKNMIIAHLKIYVDGIHIIPDYPANQEMQLYGR